ncbi:MAG: peptidase [Streptosporangiaceae bacterium]
MTHGWDAGSDLGASGVPYFSQWESAELAARFIDGSLLLAEDPRWAASGARSPAEYEYWAGKVCGLACLKMILARRGLPVPATMILVEQAIAWQAHVPQEDRVAGLIYQPFASWVAAEYGIAVEVAPHLRLGQITELASPDAPVIASVHKWIRWPDRDPPDRGGHLVLVTGAGGGMLRLHNPSGIPPASQQDTLIPVTDFGRFFARRGMVVRI